ncbi:MAG: sigma-70 family RNA polymerase sigma factor [Acidobacteria bacterium]|nr:sigma-70 family RNA polymerase sigma factor [Acidobacteriota bacterium]
MKTAGMHDLSDDQLLTLAQDGAEAAFAELMSRNSSSSFKLAISILKDQQDAEDEVQNSYWNAWRYLGRFQRDAKFSTWISRIVINQCLMRLRKARKASFLYLDEGADEANVGVMELPDRAPTPEAELGGKEMSTILHREIRRMPPRLRTVLVLRDLEELPMDDVAARLGISLVAAKSRLMRARAELKQRLEKQFGASVRNLVPA